MGTSAEAERKQQDEEERQGLLHAHHQDAESSAGSEHAEDRAGSSGNVAGDEGKETTGICRICEWPGASGAAVAGLAGHPRKGALGLA